MAYASRAGRARTSPSSPAAFSVCDRCGFWYNHVDLRIQEVYAGSGLLNINLLVCNQCWDVPNENTRAIALPADPTPIVNPRVEPFLYDETQGPAQLVGQPLGLQQAAIMPLSNEVAYGVPLSLISVISNGTTTIAVTCSKPHGMTTNGQISVLGLSNSLATGFYSVVVTSATALNYTVFAPVPAASLLTPTTRIVTANVGLPLGTTTIPVIGP